jgi:hypothetical protein
MTDNRPRPEGVIICHNSYGYRASTDLYPTVDWSIAPLHGNKPLHRNKFNFDSDKTKNHPTRKLTELAD